MGVAVVESMFLEVVEGREGADLGKVPKMMYFRYILVSKGPQAEDPLLQPAVKKSWLGGITAVGHQFQRRSPYGWQRP